MRFFLYALLATAALVHGDGDAQQTYESSYVEQPRRLYELESSLASEPGSGGSYTPTPTPKPNTVHIPASICNSSVDTTHDNCCDPPHCTETNHNATHLCKPGSDTCVHYSPENRNYGVFVAACVFLSFMLVLTVLHAIWVCRAYSKINDA